MFKVQVEVLDKISWINYFYKNALAIKEFDMVFSVQDIPYLEDTQALLSVDLLNAYKNEDGSPVPFILGIFFRAFFIAYASCNLKYHTEAIDEARTEFINLYLQLYRQHMGISKDSDDKSLKDLYPLEDILDHRELTEENEKTRIPDDLFLKPWDTLDEEVKIYNIYESTNMCRYFDWLMKPVYDAIKCDEGENPDKKTPYCKLWAPMIFSVVNLENVRLQKDKNKVLSALNGISHCYREFPTTYNLEYHTLDIAMQSLYSRVTFDIKPLYPLCIFMNILNGKLGIARHNVKFTESANFFGEQVSKVIKLIEASFENILQADYSQFVTTYCGRYSKLLKEVNERKRIAKEEEKELEEDIDVALEQKNAPEEEISATVIVEGSREEKIITRPTTPVPKSLFLDENVFPSSSSFSPILPYSPILHQPLQEMSLLDSSNVSFTKEQIDQLNDDDVCAKVQEGVSKLDDSLRLLCDIVGIPSTSVDNCTNFNTKTGLLKSITDKICESVFGTTSSSMNRTPRQTSAVALLPNETDDRSFTFLQRSSSDSNQNDETARQ
jgi:hypothetical protein